MKKVSVIIPTYKRSDNLLRAINSVLSQTYKNIEIIVVDDNDSDSIYRTENIKKLNKYVENDKIIYLKHKENKNGAAARNTGLKKATGDYITFLDDDDYFINTRIEKLVNLLEENPQYSCAYSSVAMSKLNKIIAIILANKKDNLRLDVLKQKSFFGTGSNMFFKREVVEKIGLFDEKFIRHQDMEYMVRFFEYGIVVPCKEVLVVKCIDDKSNIPDFSKMMYTKKMFLEKFNNIISQYDNNVINDIFYCNYFELLELYPDKRDELVKIIEKYNKISLGARIKLLLRGIKNNNKFFMNLIRLFKTIKYRKFQYLVLKEDKNNSK